MISGKTNRFYCFADVDIRKDIEDMLFELEQVLMQKNLLASNFIQVIRDIL